MSTFWDGSGGAIIGTLGSGLIAVMAIRRTRIDERALMREEMSIRAADELRVLISRLRQSTDRFILKDDEDPVLWDRVRDFASNVEATGDELYRFVGLIRPERINTITSITWELLLDNWAPEFKLAYAARDRDRLDDTARAAGDQLVEVASELEYYVRAEHQRQAWRRVKPWRRYTGKRRWPFVQRRRFPPLRKDTEGLPLRDY